MKVSDILNSLFSNYYEILSFRAHSFLLVRTQPKVRNFIYRSYYLDLIRYKVLDSLNLRSSLKEFVNKFPRFS